MITPSAPISNSDSTLVDEESALDPQTESVTAPFVGQWNQLISQTNWEKGRIISQWRSALIVAEAHSSTFSDDAWSRKVGAVTSQHVGRLRRVFERFGSTCGSYPGLFWSHFLAAMDWDDAELWLEGAMRSDWSVSVMRKTRWESNGGDPNNSPVDSELISSELDDDYDALTAESDEEEDSARGDRIEASGPLAEGPDFGDADDETSANIAQDGDAPFATDDVENPRDMTNPFASLPELPPDVADAMEQMKLCIVRHRANFWGDMHQKTMLDVLDALKAFAIR